MFGEVPEQNSPFHVMTFLVSSPTVVGRTNVEVRVLGLQHSAKNRINYSHPDITVRNSKTGCPGLIFSIQQRGSSVVKRLHKDFFKLRLLHDGRLGSTSL